MATYIRHQRGKHSPSGKDKWIVFRSITNFYKKYHPVKLLSDSEFIHVIATALIVIEVFLNVVIIEKVAYTEIDWKAYMQEVEGVFNGTLDYQYLKGDTGPLVYPGGFVYIFMLLYVLTQNGTNIYLAQYMYAALYIGTLYVVFRLYRRTTKVPPYALVFMCLTSYRVHSVYVLRLFNDPVAIFFLFLAVNFFVNHRWSIGCMVFSFAVSVKMNIMLFAPGLFYLLLVANGWKKTFWHIGECALVQFVVGLPFLLVNPISYITGAFDFRRVFLLQWTVNWRFIGEELFVSPQFHLILLGMHISFLLYFGYLYTRFLRKGKIPHPEVPLKFYLTFDDILLVLFASNFIGMVFCRSLHYQFYVWYFFTLPYILWSTSYSPITKLCILGFLELCWNTFPSTALSSLLLHLCHFITLYGLLEHVRGTAKMKTTKENGIKANKYF